MGRTILVVEEKEGIVVKLVKVSGKCLYYIYVWPFLFVYRLIVKKPVVAELPAGGQQQSQNITVNVVTPAPASAPAAAQVVEREVIKIRCGHCGGLVDQGVAKCPNCNANC